MIKCQWVEQEEAERMEGHVGRLLRLGRDTFQRNRCSFVLHLQVLALCTCSYQVSVDDTRLFQVGHALTHVQAHAQQGLCSKETPLTSEVI